MDTTRANVGLNANDTRGVTDRTAIRDAASLIRQWLIDYDHTRFGDPAPPRSFALAYDALARLEEAAKGAR